MATTDNPQARTFVVETRFQKMAARPGGVPRNKAIEQAQAEMGRMQPGFDEWLDKELAGFESLVRSAVPGAVDRAWLDRVALRSRQLRDSAVILRIELIAFIANSLCEILDLIEAGNDCNMDAVTCHVDALLLARQTSYRNLTPEEVPELTQGLRRVVGSTRSKRAASDPGP
jgi:hypothetical protein